MKLATYEATVEDGQIKFIEAPRLPERARVYVIVAEAEDVPVARMSSPRLTRPELAGDFTKEVVEEPLDAGVR